MPKCTGCGNEVPSNARFCAICGNAAAGTSPAATAPGARTQGPTPTSAYSTVQPAPANNNARKAAILGGTIVLLAAGLLALKMSGVLGAKATQAPVTAVLNAPTTQIAPAPLLNAPPVQAPSAPVIQAPGNPGNPMPEDIIAYLRWLKQFEAARHDLESRSAGQMQVVMAETMKNAMTGGANSGLLDGDPTETSATNSKVPAKPAFDFHVIDDIISQLNQVTGIFQQKTPPNPCAPLATSYNSALTDSVRSLSKLMALLRDTLTKQQSSNGQPPDVSAIVAELKSEQDSKGTSHSIDGTYLGADSSLNTLRSQYTNIPSDIDGSHFSIKEEAAGGGGMLPGM